MNSDSSTARRSGQNGSVFPKEKKHVSTMVGKKIAEAGKKAKKAVESAVDDAVKNHKNKGKINPDYYNNFGPQRIWEIMRSPLALRLKTGRAYLSGSIPSEIGGNCGKFEHLELAGNILVEGIPKSIGKCRGLKTLLLYSNMLEEVIPIELGQLRQLEVLDISRNNIGGSISAASSGDFFCSRRARASISCSS
ncbi:Serine/threonine protein kinase [Forsythia ovata]|uniref:Serine/threonine protein kinase n=1 Tax=Forsythia ovata TaxID=205694 RepID=A0ABD1PV36_9LAMI